MMERMKKQRPPKATEKQRLYAKARAGGKSQNQAAKIAGYGGAKSNCGRIEHAAGTQRAMGDFVGRAGYTESEAAKDFVKLIRAKKKIRDADGDVIDTEDDNPVQAGMMKIYTMGMGFLKTEDDYGRGFRDGALVFLPLFERFVKEEDKSAFQAEVRRITTAAGTKAV